MFQTTNQNMNHPQSAISAARTASRNLLDPARTGDLAIIPGSEHVTTQQFCLPVQDTTMHPPQADTQPGPPPGTVKTAKVISRTNSSVSWEFFWRLGQKKW